METWKEVKADAKRTNYLLESEEAKI